MNIRSELLAPEMQSKAVAVRVATYAGSSEKAFGELMQCFFSEDRRLSQRAAYSVGMAAIQSLEFIQPYISKLVAQLKRTDTHDALNRNITRIFEQVEIPGEFHGEVIDACFSFVQNRQTAIAIRAYSLTILYRFSQIYPEIKNELRYLIETGLSYENPAFASRGRKILKSI